MYTCRWKPTELHDRWKDALLNVPCFIVGNGWSLPVDQMDCLTAHFSIGINRAYQVIDPTILLWQDAEIWNELHEADRMSSIQALKYQRKTHDHSRGMIRYTLRPVFEEADIRLSSSPDYHVALKQSGLLAYLLARVLGCSPIVLLGMDCCYRPDGQTSFYGVNRHHGEKTLLRCSQALRWIREHDDGRVISCSQNGELPCRTFSEVLAGMSDGFGRDFYMDRLGFTSDLQCQRGKEDR